jgi:hypothetical protein
VRQRRRGTSTGKILARRVAVSEGVHPSDSLDSKAKVTPSFRLRNRATASVSPSGQPIRFGDPTHLRLPKFGPVKVFGPTRKVRRMIDASRFHIYSATLT